MKRSLLVLIALLFLSSCTDAKEEVVNVKGNCSEVDFAEGSRWINGQLKAFEAADPKLAYGFASENFRELTSIEQFTEIIGNEYPVLLDIKKSDFTYCDSKENFFLIELRITDNQDLNYIMKYVLSKIEGNWGVEGATVQPEKQT